jgi:hypothetical protein
MTGRALDRDWERMVTFYQFPREHWRHLRTSNPVESPFAAVRLRTAAAKRVKKVENATAVIWKTLLIAQKTFRRLDAPELLAEAAYAPPRHPTATSTSAGFTIARTSASRLGSISPPRRRYRELGMTHWLEMAEAR